MLRYWKGDVELHVQLRFFSKQHQEGDDGLKERRKEGRKEEGRKKGKKGEECGSEIYIKKIQTMELCGLIIASNKRNLRFFVFFTSLLLSQKLYNNHLAA